MSSESGDSGQDAMQHLTLTSPIRSSPAQPVPRGLADLEQWSAARSPFICNAWNVSCLKLWTNVYSHSNKLLFF